jgi:excisionase family DNA binding protein
MTATSPRPPAHVGDRLHDVDSAADYLRCGRRLIYRLVAERRVKFTYAGRCLRFWQTDLDAYLEAAPSTPSIHPSPADAAGGTSLQLLHRDRRLAAGEASCAKAKMGVKRVGDPLRTAKRLSRKP